MSCNTNTHESGEILFLCILKQTEQNGTGRASKETFKWDEKQPAFSVLLKRKTASVYVQQMTSYMQLSDSTCGLNIARLRTKKNAEAVGRSLQASKMWFM